MNIPSLTFAPSIQHKEYKQKQTYKPTSNHQVQDVVSFKSKEKNDKLSSKIALEFFKNGDIVNTLKCLDFDAYKNCKGEVIVFHYEQPNNGNSFADLKLDEVKLFNSIKKFEDITSLKNSSITKLKDGQIFDYLNIVGSNITNLGKTRIKTLGLTPKQAETLDFRNAKIENIFILEEGKTALKLGQLLNKATGEITYLPGDECSYSLKLNS